MKKRNTIRGIYRGQIWFTEIKNEDVHNGLRPIIIVSSWRNNIKNSRINAVVCTTQEVTKEKNFLEFELDGKVNTVLCSNVVTVSKEKLLFKVGDVPQEVMGRIDDLLRKQLQLEIFDIKKVRKLVESMENLKKFMKENKLEGNQELEMSIYVQHAELENYCKKFDEDIKNYFNK